MSLIRPFTSCEFIASKNGSTTRGMPQRNLGSAKDECHSAGEATCDRSYVPDSLFPIASSRAFPLKSPAEPDPLLQVVGEYCPQGLRSDFSESADMKATQTKFFLQPSVRELCHLTP
jgi:hypothetical protein